MNTILRVLLSSVVSLLMVHGTYGDDSLLIHENPSVRAGFRTSDAEFTPDGDFLLVAGVWMGRYCQPELRV